VAEVKRKKSETFESLLRRFHKKIQQSGRLIQSRKIRFHERPVNRTNPNLSKGQPRNNVLPTIN